MVLKVLSATCTNGNAIIEEGEATLYVCEYLKINLYVWIVAVILFTRNTDTFDSDISSVTTIF